MVCACVCASVRVCVFQAVSHSKDGTGTILTLTWRTCKSTERTCKFCARFSDKRCSVTARTALGCGRPQRGTGGEERVSEREVRNIHRIQTRALEFEPPEVKN